MNNSLGKIHSRSKPGSDEAQAIRRSFEWKQKLREVEQNLKVVNKELHEASHIPSRPISLPSRDAYATVLELEASANEAWTPALSPSRMMSKLNRALELVDRKVKEPRRTDASPETCVTNDWSHYEKVEAERRAFVEASYRRFRTSDSVRFREPQKQAFDYESLDFELPCGEVVSQPVAFPRSRIHSELHSIGVNTADQPPRGDLLIEHELATKRNEFMSRLIQSKVKDSPVIRPGDTVEVCYCSVHFPGTVVSRNVGSETFTIRFQDQSVKEFPLSSIVLHAPISYT